MNLTLLHQLLVAADRQSGLAFKVTGSRDCHEVQCMARAGMVVMSDHGNRDDPALSIDRLTPFGHTFLRTFSSPPPLPVFCPDEKRVPVEAPPLTSAEIEAKWRSNLIRLNMNRIPRSDHE